MLSRVTRLASSSSLKSFGAGGPLRKNEIAKLRVAIPDAHLNFLRKLDAKLLQDAPRVDNRARPVRRRLVPVRGQSKRRPRIAGAQRANDHVVDVVSVLHDHHVFALYARIAKLLDGFGSIAQEAASCIPDPPTPWRRRGPRCAGRSCSHKRLRACRQRRGRAASFRPAAILSLSRGAISPRACIRHDAHGRDQRSYKSPCLSQELGRRLFRIPKASQLEPSILRPKNVVGPAESARKSTPT